MNILVTNFEIKNYSGSEINAITIAKRLNKMGHNVYIAALDFGFPLISEIKDTPITLINILDGDFDFAGNEFDVVWAHHSFLLDWLIFDKGLRAKKIINSSLSPVEVFEVPPIYANEISMCIANSKETEEKLNSYEIKNVYLLENYSFKEYFERKIEIKELKNIAIVSNHVPPELYEAANALKEENYNVQIYGIEGKVELITDKVLENYDLVITIGKTVQYAMSLKIPVYIYDRFGGPGYLTMNNMELNRAHNFSGRGYSKKDVKTIVREIKGQFSSTLKELEVIKQYAADNFCFEDKIDDVLNRLNKMPEIEVSVIKQKYDRYIRNAVISKRVAEYLQRRSADLQNSFITQANTINQLSQEKNELINEKEKMRVEKDELINKLMNEYQILEQHYKERSEELKDIKNSKAWKLILFIRRILYGNK